LEPFVGKSGIMKVSNFTIDTLESEDHVVVSAFDVNGSKIEEDVIKKVFSLSAEVKVGDSCLTGLDLTKLNQIEEKTANAILSNSAERNSEFFDDEVDKLDKWAEDVKKALELDLKKLDIDIKTTRTNAKKIVDLEVKLKEQRRIKDMEKRRNEMRRKLYDAQDEVDHRKEALLQKVEAQLKQRVQLQELFQIRWKII